MTLKTWYVWQNHYGTLSVDDTEHGHYASTCLGTFDTREQAEEFCINYTDDEPADDAGSIACPICGSPDNGERGGVCADCDRPQLSYFVGI